jgi:organic radical activating enzyme
MNLEVGRPRTPRVAATTLAFVEAFGPTIQGEGPQMGKACSFIRFGACNLSCSWCDSAYTWNSKLFPPRENIFMLDPEEIHSRIPDAPALVITGGEPLMQQARAGWEEFLTIARRRFAFISMETNGTHMPTRFTQDHIDQFVVSPKLSTVDMLRAKQDRTPVSTWPEVLSRTAVDFKVVVSTPADVAEALALTERAGIPRDRLWLMPEGITTEALAQKWGWITELAAQHGCNASHRLHVLSWGEERGH